MKAVAAEAGALALARSRTGYRRWEKAGGEPVCEVDLAVDALLRERLSAIDPEAGWLSEESIDDKTRLAAERVWVVDPIDGTRDFLRGRPGWAVSIALVDRGRPVLAVLEALGARRMLDGAGRGGGVAQRRTDPLRDAHHTHRRSRSRRSAAAARRRSGRGRTKPNSIALRIAMVAAGEADLVATLRWGHEWDIAAAVLIASEAGATVTDALGAPLAFNTAMAEAFGVLVTPAGIHDAAVARLAAYAAIAERVGAR